MQGWQTRPVAGTPSREFLHDPPLREAMHPALTLRARKKPLPMVGVALLRQVPGCQVRHAVYAGAATLHQRPHFAAVVGGGSLGRPQWSASAGQGMVLALVLASGSALPGTRAQRQHFRFGFRHTAQFLGSRHRLCQRIGLASFSLSHQVAARGAEASRAGD